MGGKVNGDVSKSGVCEHECVFERVCETVYVCERE
jgi:hypothetical protein